MLYIKNTYSILECENYIIRDRVKYRCYKQIKIGEFFLENYNVYQRYICNKCIGNFLNRKVNNLLDLSIKVSKDKNFNINESILALEKDELELLKDESKLSKRRI